MLLRYEILINIALLLNLVSDVVRLLFTVIVHLWLQLLFIYDYFYCTIIFMQLYWIASKLFSCNFIGFHPNYFFVSKLFSCNFLDCIQIILDRYPG